ncbi:MAG: energy transducer TonB [Bryobacteraceae bacterium]
MTGSPVRSTFYSILLHVVAIALILFLTTGTNPPMALVGPMLLAARDIVLWPPAPDSGGGGGQNQAAPPEFGRLPRPAPRVFTAPVIEIRNLDPKLSIEPTILAPSDTVMPAINVQQWGDPAGILGTMSGGPGTNGGIGTGTGGGDGPGHGPGAGPGNKGGVGGPDSEAGRGIFTAPVLLVKTEPAYSEEARKGKVQGTVILIVEIDSNGRPRNIRIRQPLGFGLEERAVEAVSRWRFRPAYRNGKPVPCNAEVEVNFRLL